MVLYEHMCSKGSSHSLGDQEKLTAEVSQRNLKYGTNEPIYKTETDSDIENRPVVAKGRGVGEGRTGSLG